MFMDKVKKFCDHSMILWEMAGDLLTDGLPQPTPPMSFMVKTSQTLWNWSFCHIIGKKTPCTQSRAMSSEYCSSFGWNRSKNCSIKWPSYSVPVSTKAWISMHQHQTHIEKNVVVQPNLINLKGPYLKRLQGKNLCWDEGIFWIMCYCRFTCWVCIRTVTALYVRFLSFHMLGMHWDSYCTWTCEILVVSHVGYALVININWL